MFLLIQTHFEFDCSVEMARNQQIIIWADQTQGRIVLYVVDIVVAIDLNATCASLVTL